MNQELRKISQVSITFISGKPLCFDGADSLFRNDPKHVNPAHPYEGKDCVVGVSAKMISQFYRRLNEKGIYP
jgi:hypothetical protein